MRKLIPGLLLAAGLLWTPLAGLGADALTQHFLLVAPDDEALARLQELAEPALAKVGAFWKVVPNTVFHQAQDSLRKLLPRWAEPPQWATEPGPPRLVIVVTECADCYLWLEGCLYYAIRASAGHLALFPPLKHQPFPGDLGLEIRLPAWFKPADLKGLLAEALLALHLGVDASPGGIWGSGIREYTAWKLDPSRADWPYRAFGELAAQEIGTETLNRDLTEPHYPRYPELSATLISFLEHEGKLDSIFPLLGEAFPRPLSGYLPDTDLKFSEAIGHTPAELVQAWEAWLSEAEVTEAARVWYTARKYELAQRTYLLRPLLVPEQEAKAQSILNSLPVRGTWADLKELLSILEEARSAAPSEQLVDELADSWDILDWRAVYHRRTNAYLSAKVRFDRAKAAVDLAGCVEAYVNGVEKVFGPVELPSEAGSGPAAPTFPSAPGQYYTPHLCLTVPVLPTPISSLEDWTESQFQRVCELWGYGADELLSQAQAHLHDLVAGAPGVPDWLIAAVPPRITVAYLPDTSPFCRFSRCCTGSFVFVPDHGSVEVAEDLAHEPYPGDLGVEVVLELGVESGVVLHELGHAVLLLLIGIESQVPLFWNEGFAEYTAWKLDPDLSPLPYRAYARLAAEDLGESALKAALLGDSLYDPKLSSQLIAFVIDRWGRDTLFSLLHTFPQRDPATAISQVLGMDVEDLLSSWLAWLSEAEVTQATETWWFSEKARLPLRLSYLRPLTGRVRARWTAGILDRLPSHGTWHDLELVYPLLENPVREVVNRDLAEELLGLFPKLEQERDADKARILQLMLKFKQAMEAGDYRTCVNLYLQAVEAALGPLPPLPEG